MGTLGILRFRVMAENAHAKCAVRQHGAVPEPRGPPLLTSMAPGWGSMAAALGSMAPGLGSMALPQRSMALPLEQHGASSEQHG